MKPPVLSCYHQKHWYKHFHQNFFNVSSEYEHTQYKFDEIKDILTDCLTMSDSKLNTSFKYSIFERTIFSGETVLTTDTE